MDVTLKPHQLAMLHGMRSLETSEQRLPGGHFGKTTVGVIADPVGTGKSFSVLGHIRAHPGTTPATTVISLSGSEMCQVAISKKPLQGNRFHMAETNLIVTPHGAVFDQWCKYIDTCGLMDDTFLVNKTTCFDAFEHALCLAKQRVFGDTCRCSHCRPAENNGKKRKHAPVPEFHDQNGLRLPLIVLASSSMWNKVASALQGLSVARVFVDEADSVNIPAMAPVTCDFLWAITASLHNIAYANGYYYDFSGTFPVRRITDGIRGTGFVRNIFRSIQANGQSHGSFICLRSNPEFASQSFQIPEYTVVRHLCRSPMYLSTLNGIYSNEIQEMLDAGDIQGAISRIGWTTSGGMNLHDAVSNNLQKTIEERKLRLHYLENLPGDVDQDRARRIQVVKDKLHQLQQQLERVQKNMGDPSQVCPVCYDTPGASGCPKCTTMCCNNVFCMTCLHQSLGVTGSKCPMCRQPVSADSIVAEAAVVSVAPNPTDYTKQDRVLEIISSNPGSRILIFSSHDGSHATICSRLGHSVPRLCGNSNQMRAIISRFEEARDNKNVLWVNSSNFGAGINLHMTDHIIIMHMMSKDLTDQIIGRAQRHGRRTALKVHQLYHENEQLRYLS
jgi:hypothetical protein